MPLHHPARAPFAHTRAHRHHRTPALVRRPFRSRAAPQPGLCPAPPSPLARGPSLAPGLLERTLPRPSCTPSMHTKRVRGMARSGIARAEGTAAKRRGGAPSVGPPRHPHKREAVRRRMGVQPGWRDCPERNGGRIFRAPGMRREGGAR
jgi:hypothetical protein